MIAEIIKDALLLMGGGTIGAIIMGIIAGGGRHGQ